VSSAPVASPTPIICTTIGGKTPVSRSGPRWSRPLDALARPEDRVLDDGVAAVRAVMSRPSRMGTPDAISVESVRQKRATAILRRMMPRTGSFSSHAVDHAPPFSVA
jgi:hypothetical protein